jgi:hypothetical protein
MEGFSFVTPVTGLNRPDTGKEEDDDDDDPGFCLDGLRKTTKNLSQDSRCLDGDMNPKL